MERIKESRTAAFREAKTFAALAFDASDCALPNMNPAALYRKRYVMLPEKFYQRMRGFKANIGQRLEAVFGKNNKRSVFGSYLSLFSQRNEFLLEAHSTSF